MIKVTYSLIIDYMEVGQVHIFAYSLEFADLLAKRIYQPGVYLTRNPLEVKVPTSADFGF